MAQTAPHQPEHPTLRGRDRVLTEEGLRATDPKPVSGVPAVSVIRQEAKAFAAVTDCLVQALEILGGLGYTVGSAADELHDRIDDATAVVYQRQRQAAGA
jgi:hypothetical protein